MVQMTAVVRTGNTLPLLPPTTVHNFSLLQGGSDDTSVEGTQLVVQKTQGGSEDTTGELNWWLVAANHDQESLGGQ